MEKAEALVAAASGCDLYVDDRGARGTSLDCETIPAAGGVEEPRRLVHGLSKNSFFQALGLSPSPAKVHTKFNLPLAISLAGAAFEAYLDPRGARGYQEVQTSGVETMYTDSDLLESSFQGILQVHLQRASNLPAADLNGKSDPYVVLVAGENCARSKVVKANLNPQWNEMLVLYIKSLEGLKLQVHVWDSDLLSADDKLGSAEVDLSQLVPGHEMQLELQLQQQQQQQQPADSILHADKDRRRIVEKQSGVVYLSVTFASFAGASWMVVGAVEETTQLSEHATVETCNGSGAAGRDQDWPEMEVEVQDHGSDDSKQQLGAAAIHKSPFAQQAEQQQQQLQRSSSFAGGPQSMSRATSRALADELPKSEEWLRPWKVMASMASSELLDYSIFAPVAFVEHPRSDTQVWLFRRGVARSTEAACEVVVAFRGTEMSKWQDIATDMNMVFSPWDPLGSRSSSSWWHKMVALASRLFHLLVGRGYTEEMLVHSGFQASYNSVRAKVLTLVEQLLSSAGEPCHIYVTGHSLGGALATLCAHELSHRSSITAGGHTVSAYTFGSPRAGNKAFAKSYDSLVPDSWRVTNMNDVVPTLPGLLGYCHVRHSVRLRANGQLFFEAEDVAEGAGAVDSSATLLVRAKRFASKLRAASASVVDNIKAVATSLAEHEEPFYLHTLRETLLLTRPELRPHMEEALTRAASDVPCALPRPMDLPRS